jgi:hypothetical protein
MIVRMTRGHVDLDVAGRRVTVQGEAYRGDPPTFVAYRNTLTAWQDGTPLTPEERDTVLADLRAALADRGMALELE